MRVLINGVSALKSRTGVGHTTAWLHRALTQLWPTDEFWLYPGERISQIVRRLATPRRPATQSPRTLVVQRGNTRGRLAQQGIAWAKAAYRVHFQTLARWGHFDLYHEPNFVPIRTHLPTVVTVHDLSVVLHPEWHPTDRVAFHDRYFRAGIATADHIVVVSESVRREAIRHLGLASDRITAVLNGIDDAYCPQSHESVEAIRHKHQLPPRYFLVVGTIEPRKNIGMLLRVFCSLPAVMRERCPLVLAGNWGWRAEAERDYYESEARHRGVIHLGYVADADLPSLYTGATALLYPSYYEGFGLPPVEMLACGGGVIASTASAVREVVGPHAVLLDPTDEDGWQRAMTQAASDAAFLDETRRGGIEHAARFTWSRAAEQTWAVYQRVLRTGSSDASDSDSHRRAA